MAQQRWGVPCARSPFFPTNTLALTRGAAGLLLRQPADFKRYADAVWHAMWVAPRNLGNAGELAAVRQAAGFDPAAFLALLGDAEVKAAMVANTEAAVARGVFGAPTCFVGDTLFFGQARLDFVREARAAA